VCPLTEGENSSLFPASERAAPLSLLAALNHFDKRATGESYTVKPCFRSNRKN